VRFPAAHFFLQLLVSAIGVAQVTDNTLFYLLLSLYEQQLIEVPAPVIASVATGGENGLF
jgi:hypothetical protein